MLPIAQFAYSNSPPPIQTGRAEEYEVEYIHSNQTHYQKAQYYVKWKGYPLEESTWELLSNLTNAQEAVQLYLNKKNQKGGLSGEEGMVSGLTIFLSGNPGPGVGIKPWTPWDARPVDCKTACLCFSGIETPQADTKNVGTCSETNQTKEIIAPNGRLIIAPNGGSDLATISFMKLKSTPAINQEPTQERGTGRSPVP
ncbi:M-phase phosphoprotein 8 [Entomophthora muscae]|uniref:M-phase phosphoprotein 8 n=1 Tax=Entomophthora muscae TaxID=34485 RepID=A0ACC2THV4_9FUNG|nr:M-phase phosphoprotein 8 [Entomophthora muscae]